MENTSDKTVICPECRQISIFQDDGNHQYSFKAFSAENSNLETEFSHSDKILISEYHGDHYFVIMIDKETTDENIQIEGKVASTFNHHVKTIVSKINEKANRPSDYKILILSDQIVWSQLINIVYASLLQSANVSIEKSSLTTSNLEFRFEFDSLSIVQNSDKGDGVEYNAVIVDQKHLIDDQNTIRLLQRLVNMGTFVITVNSKNEDPIPKISMKDFNQTIKEAKLNFLFVDIQDLQHAAILLTQVLQK